MPRHDCNTGENGGTSVCGAQRLPQQKPLDRRPFSREPVDHRLQLPMHLGHNRIAARLAVTLRADGNRLTYFDHGVKRLVLPSFVDKIFFQPFDRFDHTFGQILLRRM